MAGLTASGRATSRSSQVGDELVDSLVLAEGEATCHASVIEGSILTATAGGPMPLNVLQGAIRIPITIRCRGPIAPGWYEVIRQRVYTLRVGTGWRTDRE